jgi:hypothetical protein
MSMSLAISTDLPADTKAELIWFIQKQATLVIHFAQTIHIWIGFSSLATNPANGICKNFPRTKQHIEKPHTNHMKQTSITMKFPCGDKELAEASRFFKCKKVTREHYRKLLHIFINEGARVISKGEGYDE